MQIKSIKYIEYQGTPQEWSLDGLTLGSRNLIVGKNASGKSRTLNIISSLAQYLTGLRVPIFSGKYDVEFDNEEQSLSYSLNIENDKVVEEKFSDNDKIYLERGKDGVGSIFAEELGKKIRFQTPPTEIAAFTRRDSIQHKFLEPLYIWANSLRHYSFGSPLGKDQLVIFIKNRNVEINERDPNAVISLYALAERKFKEDFKNIMMDDMAILGYYIEDILIKAPRSVRIETNMPGEIVCLNVKEKDFPGIVDQNSMSQGMFRALSILIQVNYSQMSKQTTCILIDDIGEGLDFDRSCKLINLLRDKAEKSSIQLVLSTNDRFVMNEVPIEEWSVIQRHGGKVQVRNYLNSHDIFEEFKFTGMSNFSFLELDFINANLDEDISDHE